MKRKIYKITIIVLVILAVIIGTMYLIDLNRMQEGKPVVFSTWGAKYAPILNVSNEVSIPSNMDNTENYQKYSKIIDNTKIELGIPNDWNYVEVPINEESPSYKYALRLYKSNENQYATLYVYDNPFGVCGTDRRTEKIALNNGKEAVIGYYGTIKDWCDISFYTINNNIAILNDGNLSSDDADEVIEFIKTINILKE